MKYLFIDTRTGGDFSLDLLFAGFVKVVGKDNVFDYPRKSKHREWNKEKADWGLERRTMGFTNENWKVSSDAREIVLEASRGNLTVITDERNESYEMYRILGLSMYNTPVVVVAGHDRFWNISPEFVMQRYGEAFLHMFLDDWQPEYDLLPKVSLINLSINYDHYWTRPEKVEKKYGIFFYGYNSHPDRSRFIDYIRNHSEWSKLDNCIMLETQPDTVGNFIMKREYFKLMAQSHVCLNLRGASTNGRALRLYEIPYVGSYMLSQRYPAKQLKPFVDGVHCDYFSDEKELDEKLEKASAIIEQSMFPTCGTPTANAAWYRETIAKAGHEHAMEHHTCEARARYLLREIGDHL